MSLTKQEIITHALRYISEDDVVDFPENEDLFCFMERKLPENKVLKDSDGWRFAGYAVCKGYDFDYDSKPQGKWLWFNFLSLNTFPPTKQCLKLQPPHIARCIFQNPQRTGEVKIIRIPDYFQHFDIGPEEKMEDTDTSSNDNLINFPQKK